MEKSKIAVAVFAVIIAAASVVKAEGTMGNLAETTDKISSIDINKNFGEAGNVLGSFYSGSKAKMEADTSVVYAEHGKSQRTPAQGEKEICNAKPSRIVLFGKVPPMGASSGKTNPEEKSLPIGAGLLAVGAIAMGLTVRGKGYFSNYSEDANTVWNYIKPGSSSDNTKPPKDPYDPPSSTPSDPYAVHPRSLSDISLELGSGRSYTLKPPTSTN